jgi:hypothetical protein
MKLSISENINGIWWNHITRIPYQREQLIWKLCEKYHHAIIQSVFSFRLYLTIKIFLTYTKYTFPQFTKWMDIPCIRFIGHTLSFLLFLTLILISTLAEGVSETNKLSFFLPTHQKYLWYKNQSHQPLPEDFVIRVYSPDIITILLSLWIFGNENTLIDDQWLIFMGWDFVNFRGKNLFLV